jgi:hypothetical protein
VASSSPPPAPAAGSSDLTPEEIAILEQGLDRVAQAKRDALADPGPTWRQWFFWDAMKWWIAVVYLIVDAWILVSWIAGGALTVLTGVGALVSIVVALYLEVLFWLYLWREPTEEGRSGTFRPGWRALRQFGRWTPEAAGPAGLGRPGPTDDGSPSPHEFL